MLATAVKNSQEIPNFKEYLWYKANEEKLLRQFYGRFLVIKNEVVIADFASKSQAWRATIRQHKPGTFIIHHCLPESEKRMPRLTNHQFVTVHE